MVGHVEYESAHERLTKGLARYPVPVMILARLAIATSWQGRGLGSGLLKDGMFRTLQAAEIAGIRAFTMHAKNDNARAFYEHSASPLYLATLTIFSGYRTKSRSRVAKPATNNKRKPSANRISMGCSG